MRKTSDRFRKMLRMVFRGIGLSVFSLIIQACYGPMTVAYGPLEPWDPNTRPRIYGTVSSNETGKPIKGIRVFVEDDYIYTAEEIGNYTHTEDDGSFILPVQTRDEYKLKLKDIDGPLNDGLFKETIRIVKQTEIDDPIIIKMEADTGTDGE